FELALHDEDADDPVIPFLIWLALEPRVVPEEKRVVAWSLDKGKTPLAARHLVPRVVRRLAADGSPGKLASALALLQSAEETKVQPVLLSALLQELGGKRVDAPAGWAELYAALHGSANPQVRRGALRLAVHFKMASAATQALEAARNESLSLEE